MSSKLITGVFLLMLATPHSARAEGTKVFTDADVTIKKLRTHKEVVEAYCYVDTGSSGAHCGAPSQTDKMDVVYVPQEYGERIVSHLDSAYKKGFYGKINLMDLFHGHFIAKGPQTEYASAAAWFNDVEMMLYHSYEYLHEVWKDLDPKEDIYKEHDVERTFAGWTKGEVATMEAAINLIVPGSLLKSYAKAGTIYAEELNESLHITSHKLSTFGGNEAWHITSSCAADEKNCKPCEIFNMMYIMQDPNGRFSTASGARVEMFFYCKFKN